MEFKEWFEIIFFLGVRKIARHITLLSNPDRKEENEKSKWEPLFEIWWGFSIKYLMPTALSYALFITFKNDLEDKYGGYSISINIFGWLLVLGGILLMILPIIFSTKWEPFEYDVDKPFDMMNKEYVAEREIKKEREEFKRRKTLRIIEEETKREIELSRSASKVHISFEANDEEPDPIRQTKYIDA